MRKGVYYSVEAVISTIMVLSVLYMIVKAPKPKEEYSLLNYKVKIMEALDSMKEEGLLRELAANLRASQIKDELELMFPELNFWVTLYSNTNLTKEYEPVASDVIVVRYLLAGKLNSYMPIEVRVKSWLS